MVGIPFDQYIALGMAPPIDMSAMDALLGLENEPDHVVPEDIDFTPPEEYYRPQHEIQFTPTDIASMGTPPPYVPPEYITQELESPFNYRNYGSGQPASTGTLFNAAMAPFDYTAELGADLTPLGMRAAGINDDYNALQSILSFLPELPSTRQSLGLIGEDITNPSGAVSDFRSRPIEEQLAAGTLYDPLNLLPIIGMGPDVARGVRAGALGTKSRESAVRIAQVRRGLYPAPAGGAIEDMEALASAARQFSSVEEFLNTFGNLKDYHAIRRSIIDAGFPDIRSFYNAITETGPNVPQSETIDQLAKRIKREGLTPRNRKAAEAKLTEIEKAVDRGLPPRLPRLGPEGTPYQSAFPDVGSAQLSFDQPLVTEVGSIVRQPPPPPRRPGEGLPPLGPPGGGKQAGFEGMPRPQRPERSAVETFVDVLNVPRSLKSTADISAPGRQGAILSAGHPLRAINAFGRQLRAWASPKYAQEVMDRIVMDPMYPYLQRANLYLSPLGADDATMLSAGEEAFQSSLAERLPVGLGKLVRASSRAFATYLNDLRAGVFYGHVRNWSPEELSNPSRLTDLADFINRASGRGDLPELLSKHGATLNAGFFSPRYFLSRLQAPASLFAHTGPARAEAVRSLSAWVGVNMATLALIKQSGVADVELSPLSSDFGKVRIGPYRYDFWGGYQQLARATVQIATQTSKSPTTGLTSRKEWNKTFVDFFRGKLAPVPGSAWNVLERENIVGDPRGFHSWDAFAGLASDLLAPIVIEDIYDATRLDGLWGAVMSAPGAVGIGVQRFGTEQEEQMREQGFYEIDNNAWKTVQHYSPEDVSKFDSYEEWRSEAMNWLVQKAKEAGLADPEGEASRALQNTPIYKARSKARQEAFRNWVMEHPEMAVWAVEHDKLRGFSFDATERNFLNEWKAKQKP